MAEEPQWEAWLADQFPGFLLPSAMHHAIEPEVAARFLARLGRPDHLRLLQASAAFSPPGMATGLRRFIHDLVPSLVEVLPSQTEVYARRWQEGFQGRLDVRATVAEWMAGNPSTFVTRARRRNYDLPETVLLKSVLNRIGKELARLRDARLMPGAAWSLAIDECATRISQLLLGTHLRAVTDRPVEAGDVDAARRARDPAFREAEFWHQRLRVAFDEPTERATADLLAAGALTPMSPETRFEIAVVLRLLGAVWGRVREEQPGRWTLSHGLIHKDRGDLATIHRDDGAVIRLYYNQVVLTPGPRDLDAARYFGGMGRLRPDWTVAITPSGGRTRFIVGEVKHSHDETYQRTGFSEAVLYRFEYGDQLAGWLKSMLVVPAALPGKARFGDPTIAVGWPDWVPRVVVDGVLEGVVVQPPDDGVLETAFS